MENPRRIAIIIGSDSDLPQTKEGLKFLTAAVFHRRAIIVEVYTASIHRNTECVLDKIRPKLAQWIGKVDVIIAGAGWANHLTGTIDAYLRFTVKDEHIVVVGVPFEDDQEPAHSVAAVYSIIYVPDTQVVYHKDWGVGEKAFLEASKFAAEGKLPVVKAKIPKPTIERTLEKALEAANKAWSIKYPEGN